MKDNVIRLLIVYLLAAIAMIGCAYLLSSCKIMKDVKREASDSTHLKTDNTVYSTVDTSKKLSEKDYERTTYIYNHDTTVNYNYFPKPTVVIHEKGQEVVQEETFDYKDFRRELLDSLARKTEVQHTETKTRVGPSMIEWILIVGLALVLLKDFVTIRLR